MKNIRNVHTSFGIEGIVKSFLRILIGSYVRKVNNIRPTNEVDKIKLKLQHRSLVWTAFTDWESCHE